MKYGHSWAFIRCCSFPQVFQISWSDFCDHVSSLPVYHCAVQFPPTKKCISLLLWLRKAFLDLKMKLFYSSELERIQPPSASEVPTAIWNIILNINIHNLALQSKYQFWFFLFFFHSKVVNVYFIGILWWFYVW